MLRAFTAILAVAALSLAGCAPSAPPKVPVARPFDDIRRVLVVVSGESAFAIVDLAVEPGRTFDEILKWIPPWWPYQAALRPAAALVHRGINWALDSDRTATAVTRVQGLSPRAVVAGALASTLEGSGWFEEVRALDREPTAEERRAADAVVRVAVPAWGLVRVRDGEAGLLSGFADVRARMTMPATGVMLWDDSQDVTSPDRVPVDVFLRDRNFAQREMAAVLERAGQRLASELLYARSAGL